MNVERRIKELERHHEEARDVHLLSDSQLVFIATKGRIRDPKQVSIRELELLARPLEHHNGRVGE